MFKHTSEIWKFKSESWRVSLLYKQQYNVLHCKQKHLLKPLSAKINQTSWIGWIQILWWKKVSEFSALPVFLQIKRNILAAKVFRRGVISIHRQPLKSKIGSNYGKGLTKEVTSNMSHLHYLIELVWALTIFIQCLSYLFGQKGIKSYMYTMNIN